MTCPNFDDLITTAPDDGEPEQEDPREECGTCGAAFDPGFWVEGCPECRWREHQAPVGDLYDRTPTMPLGNPAMPMGELIKEDRR